MYNGPQNPILIIQAPILQGSLGTRPALKSFVFQEVDGCANFVLKVPRVAMKVSIKTLAELPFKVPRRVGGRQISRTIGLGFRV